MPEQPYVLLTGDPAEARLEIVDRVHGPHTQAFLTKAGLLPGMNVAELGCGVGLVTERIARTVGKPGHVIALDASHKQTVAAARRLKTRCVTNVEFVTADAGATGLDEDSFDFVYCRFLLMHMHQPEVALAEMLRILKPCGILAVEDGDFSSPFCWPASRDFNRAFELYVTAGESCGADFLIGQRLFQLVANMGLQHISIETVQPVCVDAEECSLVSSTLNECRDTLLKHNLATRKEIDETIVNVNRAAMSGLTVFGMARMTQVSGRKPQKEG